MSEAPSPRVVGLVLAAGSSRRFGADKRCARLADGRPLLASSVAVARLAFSDVRVVLRTEDDARALGLDDERMVIRSEQAELGMGHSLAAGVRALLASSSAEAVAILLGDMPWIAPASLAQLAAAADPAHIVLPWHAGQRGQPVLFGRAFWAELSTCSGDSGAKALLQRHAAACRPVQLDDPGILRDVDQRSDLAPR